MRSTILLLLAGLALPIVHATAPAQSGDSRRGGTQDEKQDEPENPYLRGAKAKPSLADSENARLDKQIQGAWMMTGYIRDDTIVPSTEVRGFAMFHEGYMTFNFQALEEEEDFFFAEEQYVVQSAVFRYQLFDGHLLQVAGLMGYTNANEDYELEFGSTKIPREYEITLNDDTLSLRRLGGIGFDFRRMRRTPFPESAQQQLQRQRGGFELIDDNDPFGSGGDIDPPADGGGDGDGR